MHVSLYVFAILGKLLGAIGDSKPNSSPLDHL